MWWQFSLFWQILQHKNWLTRTKYCMPFQLYGWCLSLFFVFIYVCVCLLFFPYRAIARRKATIKKCTICRCVECQNQNVHAATEIADVRVNMYLRRRNKHIALRTHSMVFISINTHLIFISTSIKTFVDFSVQK